MMNEILAPAIFIVFVTTADASNLEEDDFVSESILSILYHELGHAMIDLLGVSIFGKGDDVVDVVSTLMVDFYFEEEIAAQDIAINAALLNSAFSLGGEEVLYWDKHGPDEERYYSQVCIFYGGNIERRANYAEIMGLTEDRAKWCEEEYNQASDS
tara:strand:- start:167 stop:634 length:468 start_codon:yes stop_codon:yes gene_type:complete